jgi:threonine/homoserine/homoserine lactone efflux protein
LLASQLLGLSNAARYEAVRAVAGIGGRLAAFVLLIGLVVAGLGSLLASSAGALAVVKWVGVGYLAWLGFAALRRAWRVQYAVESPVVRGGMWASIKNEFIVGISNPKAMLLFAALLPQFASGEGLDAAVQLGLLGAAYLVVEFFVGLGFVGVGAAIGAIAITPRVRQWAIAVVGCASSASPGCSPSTRPVTCDRGAWGPVGTWCPPCPGCRRSSSRASGGRVDAGRLKRNQPGDGRCDLVGDLLTAFRSPGQPSSVRPNGRPH